MPRAGADAGCAGPWQLMLPLTTPAHLERDRLMVPDGPARLRPLPDVRWSEPPADAIPRLLRADLAQALGAPVWSAPLPPGIAPARQLRVELMALDVAPGSAGVTLRAQWSVADPAGRRPPVAGATASTIRATADGLDALVLAHRAAVAGLAQRIAEHARESGCGD